MVATNKGRGGENVGGFKFEFGLDGGKVFHAKIFEVWDLARRRKKKAEGGGRERWNLAGGGDDGISMRGERRRQGREGREREGKGKEGDGIYRSRKGK
ncbi:hypothetical protein ACH5RR_002954 [Cinchona calisaya]|uniref:Uncharacterized protein n=1 Tax=Cinchona calisaya TaxID=153742 RepID=A0ABD3ATJ9_9GENT